MPTEAQTPMLSASQINRLWEEMLSAEIRALYFADMGDYRALWDNVYMDEAQAVFEGLIQRGHDLFGPATTMPRDERALSKWQDYVLGRYYQGSGAN